MKARFATLLLLVIASLTLTQCLTPNGHHRGGHRHGDGHHHDHDHDHKHGHDHDDHDHHH